MKDPNSLWMRFRLRLAARLDPMPDLNEAWCMNCELNRGRTRVVPVDGMTVHAQLHADSEDPAVSHQVQIRARRAMDRGAI